MRYHEFPKKYNWNNLPNKINNNSHEGNEIAKLMRDVGIAVKMKYECVGSSAYMIDAVYAFTNNFNYSNKIKLIDYQPRWTNAWIIK